MPKNVDYKVITEKQVSIEKWWSFIENCDSATFFHTPIMHNAFIGIKKHKPFALFAIDNSGRIVGMLNGYFQRMVPLLPHFLSRRGVITQAPLFTNESVLNSLLYSYRRKYSLFSLYTEIRAHKGMDEYDHVLKKFGFYCEDHLNIVVDLTQSVDDLWKQVHSKRRNEIRKAQKNKLFCRELQNHELSKAYEILVGVYQRAKLPLLSIGFFQYLMDNSIPCCRLRVYGAFFEDQMIGTMFTLQYKKTVYDFYAGSKSEYYHLNPNDLIPWCVFIEGKRLGFVCFDFGGAGKPSVPYGVRDYKMKFGGSLLNYGRYKFTAFYFLLKLFEIALHRFYGKRI